MEEQKTQVTTHAHRRPNYLLIFLALTVMTVLEVGITYISGIDKAPFLLGMSFIKAMLVILYFMHLRSDNPWYRMVFFIPFLLVIPLVIVSVTQ